MIEQMITGNNGPEVTDFVIPYPDEQKGLPEGIESISCCVDKRCPHHDDEVLSPFTYYQTAGGEHGIGVVTAIAIEVEHPGRTANMPSFAYGKTVSLAARIKNRQFYAIHNECKAIEAGITGILANDQDGELVENATIIEPMYSAVSHEEIVLAAGRRTLEQRRPADIYRNLVRSIGEAITRPAATLLDNNHQARAFLAIHGQNQAFDVKAADAADRNAYVVTRDPITRLAPLVSRMFGIKPETFIAVFGGYHAAVHKGVGQGCKNEIPVIQYGTAV